MKIRCLFSPSGRHDLFYLKSEPVLQATFNNKLSDNARQYISIETVFPVDKILY